MGQLTTQLRANTACVQATFDGCVSCMPTCKDEEDEAVPVATISDWEAASGACPVKAERESSVMRLTNTVGTGWLLLAGEDAI